MGKDEAELVANARPEWFAGRLYELRTEAGMSRQAVAEASGMQRNAINQIESGANKPNWTSVLQLCRGLGVTPLAFMSRPEVETVVLPRGASAVQEFEYAGWRVERQRAASGYDGWIASKGRKTLAIPPTKERSVFPREAKLAIDKASKKE